MRLILVRHGQTPSNVAQALDTGEPGAPLTDLGHEQAAALVPSLGAEPIDVMVASHLTRARQTAAPLAQHLKLDVEIRPGIREILAGDLEMRTDQESAQLYGRTVMRWSAGELDLQMPGGETGHDFFGRYDEVVAELFSSGVGTAVAVSHGAAMRSWVAARAQNISLEQIAGFVVHNTGAIVLDGTPDDGWNVLTWTDHTIGGEELEDTGHEGPAAEPARGW